MQQRRLTVLAVVLLGVVTIAAVSFYAGSYIQSPAEIAARTAPPAPSLILVPIEERILTSKVITRGTARYGAPIAITPVLSMLKQQSGIVTTTPNINETYQEGDVLFTLSGRPVFLFKGEVPAYRDLVPGTSGEDVYQLEQAFGRLGLDLDEIDQKFTPKTSQAIDHFYKKMGWERWGPSDQQQEGVDKARKKLLSFMTGEIEYHLHGKSTKNPEGAQSESGYRCSDIVKQRHGRTPIDQSWRASLTGELQTQTSEANSKPQLSVSKLRQERAEISKQIHQMISSELDQAVAATRPSIPADEFIFLPDLPVRVDQVTAQIGDRANKPIVTVTDNNLIIDSTLTLEAAQLVRSGMQVEIDEPTLGIKARGIVAEVAEQPGTHGADSYHYHFKVKVSGNSQQNLNGVSLRLTIPVKSTERAVTVVPVNALITSADGLTRIQVKNAEETSYVLVRPGLSANGYVEVAPVEGNLKAGQLVVIGLNEITEG